MHVELKHTVTVSAHSWYIRFYLWLYEADVKQVTFCKLFWAYAFVLPFFLARFLIIEPLRLVVLAHESRKSKRKPKVTMRVESEPQPSAMSRGLSRVENTGARFVLGFRAAWHVVGMDGKVALWLGRALMVIGFLIGLAVLVGLIYLLILVEWVQLVGLSLVIFALLLLLGSLINIAGKLERFGEWALPGAMYAGRSAKRGIGGFFGMMRIGYIAVKSSTCPRIEVKG